MVKPYSEDLRWRVVSRVLEGSSCRDVAATFGVSVSSVVSGRNAFGRRASVRQAHGQPQAAPVVGAWLLGRIAAKPHVTCHELVAELQSRGVVASYGSV